MIVKIEHPQHGQMHVYTSDDLERHLGWGWTVVEGVKPALQEQDAPLKADNIVPIKKRNLGSRGKR